MVETPPGLRERGFAIAAVRVLGLRGEALCARRHPGLRMTVATLTGPGADKLRDEALADPNLRGVHPSWYEAPPPSVRASAVAYLSRLTTAHLVTMTPLSDEPFHNIDHASQGELESFLYRLGKIRVGTAFSGAPRTALAQLCARLGEPWATELLRQVQDLAGRISATQVRAAQRHLGRSGVDTIEDARTLFLRSGCQWLAPALHTRGGELCRRTAQRLPRPLGTLLLQAALQPVEDAPEALQMLTSWLTRVDV